MPQLKIGIIGLGDIAKKAYLPILTRLPIKLHLCTRNEKVLTEMSTNYRISHTHATLESLVASGITGAFIHSSTASHVAIVERLLAAGIHTYVDKPLADNFQEVDRLHRFAREKKLLLMVGFNRRYAPAYHQLKDLPGTNMIILQKNRYQLPGDVRTFVFDDFIHVIDTLLFYLPQPVERWQVEGKKRNGKLYHVVLTLHSSEALAIGIMNRDAGTTEEKMEVFTPVAKHTVIHLNETIVSKNQVDTHTYPPDWTETLHKRGFVQIIDAFLTAVASDNPVSHQEEFLTSHRIAEDIVTQLENSP